MNGYVKNSDESVKKQLKSKKKQKAQRAIKIYKISKFEVRSKKLNLKRRMNRLSGV
jgi:hypothetical protein